MAPYGERTQKHAAKKDSDETLIATFLIVLAVFLGKMSFPLYRVEGMQEGQEYSFVQFYPSPDECASVYLRR